MTFKLKLVKQPSFELSFSNLVVRGVDPSDATATEEDVFADATFYAGNNELKTGALDPYIEYIKFDKTLSQLESPANGTATETDYAMWKSRVEMYNNRIFKGDELKRWLL